MEVSGQSQCPPPLPPRPTLRNTLHPQRVNKVSQWGAGLLQVTHHRYFGFLVRSLGAGVCGKHQTPGRISLLGLRPSARPLSVPSGCGGICGPINGTSSAWSRENVHSQGPISPSEPESPGRPATVLQQPFSLRTRTLSTDIQNASIWTCTWSHDPDCVRSLPPRTSGVWAPGLVGASAEA